MLFAILSAHGAVAAAAAAEGFRHYLGPSGETLQDLAESAGTYLEANDPGAEVRPDPEPGAIIDAGLCAPAPMAVDVVEAVFGDSEQTDEELHLQVWRHERSNPAMVNDLAAGGWDLVHEVIVRREIRVGKLVFEHLDLPEPLVLDVGDCIGWYSPAAGSMLFLNDPLAPGILEVGSRRPARVRIAEVGALLGNGPGRTAMRVEGSVSSNIPYIPPHPHARAPSVATSRSELLRVCDATQLPFVGCNITEPGQLVGRLPLDWAKYLEKLCSCTQNEALLGRSIDTLGACCDLDHLDYALTAAGHPAGIGCLPGFLSILSSCSARLGMRQDYGTVYAGMSSVERRSNLRASSLVHLASNIVIEPSPLVGPLRDHREGWNLIIYPSLGMEPNQTRTYRLIGTSLEGNFAPFPFGRQDLYPWLAQGGEIEYKLWSDVLIGLSMAGVPAFAFLGSKRRLKGSPRSESFDIIVPWSRRPTLANFATLWMAADERRHVAKLPRHFEFVLLPTPELKKLWPSDFSFRAVCPSCSHALVYFHFKEEQPGGEVEGEESGEILLTTFPGEPCAWPMDMVFPLRQARPESPNFFGGAFGSEMHSWPNAIEELEALALASFSGSENWEAKELKDKPDRIREARLTQTVGQCWDFFHYFLPADIVAKLGFARNNHLAEEFDMSALLQPGMGLYDLYDLRKDISHPRFEVLADKVALKTELAALNCSVARVYYSSYTSPDILDIIRDLPRYAVKAGHKHHGGRGVLLVGNGQDMRSGKHLTPEDVQAITLEMWEPDPYAGEQHCFPLNDGTDRVQCVTNAPALDKDLKQAILVEELALTWDGKLGLGADEAFCFVAWSRLCFCGVMANGGVWGGYFARDGTFFYGLPMHKETGIRDDRGAALRPPVPWPKALREDVVALAERVAHSLKADFIRVDVFPNGGVPIVAEVSIVSGWLGRANLRWGEVDAWMLGLLGERWMEGYGQAGLLR